MLLAIPVGLPSHSTLQSHPLQLVNSFMKVIAIEPTLRRSAACLSSRKLGFNPRPVKVKVK